MVEFDFNKILRSTWKVQNLKIFIEQVRPFFPQVQSEDLAAIISGITSGEVPYFEIPSYPENDPETDIPELVIVFKNNLIYVDIFNVDKTHEIIEKIKFISNSNLEFIDVRPLSEPEWDERLQAIEALQNFAMSFDETEDFESNGNDMDEEFEDESEEDEFEDFHEEAETFAAEYADVERNDDEIEDELETLLNEDEVLYKDEEGIVDRGAFVLFAKQPVVEWLNICLEREAEFNPDQILRDQWTLTEINRDPQVFLVPSDIETLSAEEQLVAWEELKFKSFAYFLNSFYHEDEFWPAEISMEVFEQWFEFKRLGYVIDLHEGV